jgi:hypothetical protein
MHLLCCSSEQFVLDKALVAQSFSLLKNPSMDESKPYQAFAHAQME